MYNIGQDIDINILISNDEVLDNILYLKHVNVMMIILIHLS